MRISIKNIAAGVTLVSATILAGCATTSDLEALRADVQRANETASRAASDAAAAQRDAAAAKAAAEAARDTAQDTNEKLDRMFKKSMYKYGAARAEKRGGGMDAGRPTVTLKPPYSLVHISAEITTGSPVCSTIARSIAGMSNSTSRLNCA